MNARWSKKDSESNSKSDDDAREMDLISRTARGDDIAFGALYTLYYARLYRFVYRMKRGNWGDIEEIINDVMFVVWEKSQSYDQRCRPSTWIFGIAYNKVRKYFKISPETISFDDAVFYENTIPVDSNLWSKKLELKNWIEAALETLSPEQRTVVELSYFHGMHYDEISKVMECPENTVKTRMYHARKKLGAMLRKN